MTGLVLSAVLFCAPPAGGPSPVLLPQQSIPLNFSHALHLKKNIACDYCHERAPESTSSSDFLIPKEESCSDCHAIDHKQPEKQAKIAARCDACHPGYRKEMGENVARVVVPAPHLKFNHKIHIGQQIRCQQCHGEMTDVELATRDQLPRMEMCLKCHIDGKRKAPSRCSTCHLTTAAGTMQTSFDEGRLAPSGAIRGDSHTPDFRRNHANVARSDEQYCLNCHRRDECLSCHNGVLKPMDMHGNDYVSIHSTEARRDSMRCQSCHRYQSFCVGCHQRSGVALDVPGGVPLRPNQSPLRFHPDGWTKSVSEGGFPSDSNHHAWQAMRNIRACASCHREQTCLRCHVSKRLGADGVTQPFVDGNPQAKSQYVGTDPHPPGWGGKCRALIARNQRVCMKCHVANDPCLTCNPSVCVVR